MAGKLASGGGGKGMQPNAEPNVIPFIDIMLVLLIIFMVAAPLPTVDIRVDLPPPGRPIYTEPTDKPTTVAMDDVNGLVFYYIEGELVPKERFRDRLLQVARERNPSYASDLGLLFSEAKVFVDADQESAYNNVIGLINEIDQTGFKKVSLLVKEAAI
ncbi:MAG: biopolymer transporter ExbD [Hyphomonadaceae bacterium]|nr:MAG: biopolymer transport protein ExbD [Caulobacteraceae bacterium]MBT9445460.1 biopolymer transporter ExbD [Hyphomonadaceae bacterium]TPW03423.1 MAG: biopolymer transport protein ExbD [Alphaproteobacteria bacterium]